MLSVHFQSVFDKRYFDVMGSYTKIYVHVSAVQRYDETCN